MSAPNQINFGDVLTCTETGKTFIAAQDGITANYARDSAGNVFSDEGVRIRQERELLDRSNAFYCYVSSDGRSVTGWKGNVLGRCDTRPWAYARRTAFGYRFRVIDMHGQWWQGRGAGPGMCCTLRPMQEPRA